MKNKQFAIVAKNPFQYTYFCQKHPEIKVIGSKFGAINDYAQTLHMPKNLVLFDCVNKVDELIKKAQQLKDAPEEFITWRSLAARKLEQKAYLRSVLPADVFPEFCIIEAKDLKQVDIAQLKQQLVADSLVLQIDFSTGGMGTFFVEDQVTYEAVLPKLLVADQKVVISRHIEGTSRALQCFMDEEVIYPSWWHRDLISVEGVCSPAPGSTKYSGAIMENLPDKYRGQVKELVEKVQKALQKQQFYGVFGLDIVVEKPTDRIYLIEMNPRFTAVSHIYATAMHALGYDGDFITAQVEGTIYGKDSHKLFTDSFGPKTILLPQQYYYLKIQNLGSEEVSLSQSSQLGVYDDNLNYRGPGFGVGSLKSSTDIIVIPESAKGVALAPGKRVFSVIGIGNPVDERNKLDTYLHTKIQGLATKLSQAA